MKPFFSVVIPTYNRSDKLKRAVESVLVQTFTEYEILVMDDGSTDDTANVMASFSDSRIVYQWEENFGGPARPRNRGIEIAKGEWICFLDADDFWSEDKLKICHENINENVDFLYHKLDIVRDIPKRFGRLNVKSWQVHSPVSIDLLLRGNAIANSSVVVRRSVLEKAGRISEDLKLISAEDYNTWLRVSLLTDRFNYIAITLGYYSIHGNNISTHNKDNHLYCAICDIIDLTRDRNNLKLMSALMYSKGRISIGMGDYTESRSAFWYSFRLGGLYIKSMSLIFLALISIKSTGRMIKEVSDE